MFGRDLPRTVDNYMLNLRVVHTVSTPESIEWFIEYQASLRSQDSAPRPPPSPLSRPCTPSPVSKLSLFLSLPVSCVASPPYWRERWEEGVGVEPNQTTARKPGPLQIIQYSRICNIYPPSSLLLPLCKGPKAKVTMGAEFFIEADWGKICHCR